MLRLGIAGEADSFHARAIASIINGERVSVGEKEGVFAKVPELGKIVQLESVWDPVKQNAENLAKRFGIPKVSNSPEELANRVDGVMILGDISMQFQRHAPFFMRARVPCYVDKPLSPSYQEAKEIINLVEKTKTPFFSCSAARYAPQLQEFRENLLEEIGSVVTGTLIGPKELIFYGVHLVDILFSIVGDKVVSVKNIGKEGEEIIKLTFQEGRSYILEIFKQANTRFHVFFLGKKGWKHIYIDNYRDYFSGLIKVFCEMVQTKKLPIPLEQILKTIQVLTLAKESREKRGEELQVD